GESAPFCDDDREPPNPMTTIASCDETARPSDPSEATRTAPGRRAGQWAAARRKKNWALTPIFVVLAAGCADSERPAAGEAQFVGTAVCAGCHADEAQAWTGSHHDLAMQPSTS